MRLEGRRALVTGGSRGIGRGIALALAGEGADVLVNYRRDREAAEATCEEIRKLGRGSECYQASIDDREQVTAMVEEIERDHGSGGGSPSILIHNAGIASRGHTVEDTDPDELERVVRVHALGPHFLTQKMIPGLRRHERSDVVMISSVATLHYAANGAPYSMGKAAMEALAFTLAKELRSDGVRVNVVAPGLVETEMGRRLMKARAGIEDLRELDAKSPFGRVCQPRDIADAVLFFVAGSSYVTGEKLNVHGGGR